MKEFVKNGESIVCKVPGSWCHCVLHVPLATDGRTAALLSATLVSNCTLRHLCTDEALHKTKFNCFLIQLDYIYTCILVVAWQ